MLLLLSLLGTTFCSTKNNNPYLLIKFHANWCTTCQVWDKSGDFKQLQDKAQQMGVEVNILDFTNQESQKKSQQLAKTLGIHEIYEAYAKNTGFALIIHRHNNKIITTIQPKKLKINEQINLVKAVINDFSIFSSAFGIGIQILPLSIPKTITPFSLNLDSNKELPTNTDSLLMIFFTRP